MRNKCIKMHSVPLNVPHYKAPSSIPTQLEFAYEHIFGERIKQNTKKYKLANEKITIDSSGWLLVTFVEYFDVTVCDIFFNFHFTGCKE